MMEFYVGAQKVFCDIGKRSGRCERPIGLVLIYWGIEPPESRLSGGVLWLKIKSRIRRRYAATFFDKVMGYGVKPRKPGAINESFHCAIALFMIAGALITGQYFHARHSS